MVGGSQGWVVFREAIPWLLRVLLIDRAGVEPDLLRNAIDESMAFAYSRANVAPIAENLGWSEATYSRFHD